MRQMTCQLNVELLFFAAKEHLNALIEAVHRYDDCLEKSVIVHADCKKLLKLEGVGTMNAINLYLALGCAELGVFSKGKDASACIGLTPIQHSSGGGGIRLHRKAL
jgi:transposase